MVNNYITPEGYQKLIQEQDHLLKKERPEVVKIVTWAASLGDRSENADYQYGKKRLREIDRRLRFLKKRIELAKVVRSLDYQGELVKFGARVRVETEDGEEKVYHIVGEDEIELKIGKISWKSPVARALFDKEVGDIVNVRTPQGLKEIEILEISYRA